MAGTETRRQSILRAAIRVFGRQGYGVSTVDDVVEEAGASTEAFHEHFGDKQECFLAAHDMAVERIGEELRSSCGGGEAPWPERMRAGLAALVELLAADPELARTAVVEARMAGAEARRRHWDAVGGLSRSLEEGREMAGGELPDSTALMAAGAVAGLIFEELLSGGAEGLPALLPDLVFAMLVPYLGPSGATEEMRKAAADASTGP